MRFNKDTTKAIRKWLRENDFHCGCRLDKEFYFEPTDNYIAIPKKYDNEPDYTFIKVLRAMGLKNDLDCMTLSVLHELGHCQTEKYFTCKEWEKDSQVKDRLEKDYNGNYEEYLIKYWQTKTENIANEWVVMYANNFTEKCEELEELLILSI